MDHGGPIMGDIWLDHIAGDPSGHDEDVDRLFSLDLQSIHRMGMADLDGSPLAMVDDKGNYLGDMDGYGCLYGFATASEFASIKQASSYYSPVWITVDL
jgi:hypothetical protein